MSSVAEQPLHRALGLTDGELDRIQELLGRSPNELELAVFSLLWSEHCGYKHSALLLRRFPTEGPGVLQGPGENAGVVDLGEGAAVAFKVESHNHPSAVEPFQGAATGIGGILRDVIAMGARPIALLDGLRFGAPDWSFWRAVGGIGHYGNCLAGDEWIVFRNSSRLRGATIADIATDRGVPFEATSWTGAPSHPLEVLSFDPEKGKAEWRPVARIFKRTTHDLVRIKAALGRTMTVSPDHPVMVWESSRLVARLASEVQTGDRLPLISSLPKPKQVKEIDLIEAIDEPLIVIFPANWSASDELRRSLRSVMPRADMRHRWLSRRELPVWAFREVEGLIGIPRRALRLRLMGPRSTAVPAVIRLEPDVARLIGYYISEGCCSQNGSTFKLIWTFGKNERDDQYVRDVCAILKSLGIRHSTASRQATVVIVASSRILGRLFRDVLSCGCNAGEKQIPSILFQGSARLRVEVLKGIFRGDGSIRYGRGNTVRVSHSTVSRQLHEQLILLLQSRGIFPSRYTRQGGDVIAGRRVVVRPAYALEFSACEAVAQAARWFPEPDANRMLAAIAPTRGSRLSHPRARREGAIATIPVTQVEQLKESAEVYDFEVPGTHLFATSGGVVTHNCVGVATVGGDTFFDEAYANNPLVNAMCVGILPTERLTRASARGIGNLVVLYGATTGRDGIGGASVLASQELSEEDADKRPTVQIGDPFTGKKLIEASLELVEAGVVVSLQDLGAAGLASSLAEMAGRGGSGIDVHLDRVPLREPDLEPYEIIISESQERMVALVEPHLLERVTAVLEKWELAFAVIGEVADHGELRVHFQDEEVGAIAAAFLTEEAPRYRVAIQPRELEEPVAYPPIDASAEALLELLSSPNISSREPVYRRYDHLVGSRTVRRPGLDAAVLRLRPSFRALAVSLDGAGRLARLDPRAGGMLAVLEAARNVACAGGRPLALTDCLNFGNPEKPEVAWELAEAIEGMALACEALEIPVVSGNVSLYNETDGRPIYPTPVVGCVGLVADVREIPSVWRAGDVVLVAGEPRLSLDGSEYQARILGGPAGRPSLPDLAAEVELIRFLWRSAPVLSSAHDSAEGGLAIALAESALVAGVGAEVELDGDACSWFGEGGGQAIVTCRPEDVEQLDGIPLRRIGLVGGERLLGVELADLGSAHGKGLGRATG